MLAPWMRKGGTVGERFYGMHALLGFLTVFFWSAFFPHDSPEPMLAFLGLTTLLLLWNRVQGFWMRRKGYRTHSLYTGDSRLGWFGQRAAKTFLEPLTAIVIGALLMGFSAPLGGYLMTAGFCLAVDATYQVEREQAVLRRRQDAQLEAMYYQQLDDERL
jgi:hypothetical protein